MASPANDNPDDLVKKISTTAHSFDSDIVEDNVVQDFGYEPTYSRVFRTIGSMSLTLAMASPMCGVFVAISYQVTYGGYWGLTWGWVIPAVLFSPWALTTAEFCSSMPVNGANYWWTAALAPPSISRPVSFIAGMANVMNALTSIASFAWASSASLATIIAMRTGWEPTNAAMFAIAEAICLLWLLTACLRMDKASQIYIGSATIVLITSAIFFVGLPVSHARAGIPFTKASTAFGEYTNYSDWEKPVAVPFTFFTAAWVITGWNAPSAVVEETHNARIVAPRAIVTTYSLMAVMGTVVCFLLAFCITDMDAAAADPTGFPVFALLVERWGMDLAVAFLLIIFCNTMVGGAAVLVMMSCQVAAFARDGGLVFNEKLARVHPRSNMPLWSSVMLTTGGMLLLFLAFSPIASEIIFSLAVVAIMVLYAVPMVFRIFDGGRWVPGPWNYGIFSRPIHIFGFLSVVYMTIMECFPPEAAWTGATLNYNWAVFLAAILLSVALWLLHGTHHYKGPDQELLAAWRARLHSPNSGSETSAIHGMVPSVRQRSED